MTPDERKAYLKENKLPIAAAWALVAHADRINEGVYIKFPEMSQDTGQPMNRANRAIITDAITMGLRTLTNKDYEVGAAMADHFQYIAFDALAGTIKEFDQKILNFITAAEVDDQGMVYMACMGSRYHRELIKEVRQELTQGLYTTSMHQGVVGQHIRINVKTIAKFAGKVFTGSVVRATDGANLYFWTSSQLVDMWPDMPEEYPIVGVVKAHGHTLHGLHNVEYDGINMQGPAETRLTRVKIVM